MRGSKRVILSATLAGAWLLSAAGGYSQTIPNPSFEANSFSVFPGYVSGNAAIDGWFGGPEERIGLNPAGGSPFADNGVVPEGNNVAFLQSADGTITMLNTVISGLTVNTKYKLTFRANARGGQAPNLRVMVDNEELLAVRLNAVTGTNPYWYVVGEFTALLPDQTLTLINDAAGDTTVVVDDFKIAPSNESWTIAAWTGDEDIGVDNTFLYTHAYSFGSGSSTVINGIPFTGVADANPTVPGRFTTTLLRNVFLGDVNNLTGNSLAIAKDFLYGGAVAASTHEGITLQGLTPGTEYVATVFSVGWEAPSVATRWATFGIGEERMTMNQDQFDDNNGIAFSCRYTADATGTALIKISPFLTGGDSIHIYGFCNREAASRDFAPVVYTQPENRVLALGQPGKLSVIAAGVPAPTYQWRLNGQNITDATEATLTIPEVAEADAGDYDVVISNSAGTTTSAVAKVTVGIALANPSFEKNSFAISPGYVNDNGDIEGWVTDTGGLVGLNPAENSPFADNGAIPDGSNVAFIQSPGSLSTLMSGLTIGTTYKVSLRANARTAQTPFLRVLVDDYFAHQEILAVAVQAVTGFNPYWYVGCEFTATAEEQVLILLNDAAGDTALLVDDISVAPTSGKWKVTQWNSDADSGLDGNFPYTHAYNFGSAASFMINGVAFTGVAGPGPSVAGKFTTSLFRNVFNNDTDALITGNSKTLANDFVYAGNVSATTYEGITLLGLTPGEEYVLTVYTVAFDPPGPTIRWATWSFGDDYLTINQDQFGNNNGMTVNYTYTAGPDGTATVKIAPLQPANMSIHIYGFSNRQAVSPYYAPVIVAQPQSQWLTAGLPATLSVTANALPAATYQWQLNGEDILDATTATFTLPQTSYFDAGDYTVVVANQMGAVTSQVARLTLGIDTVVNASFETDVFGTWPGYVSGNFPISGWNALGGHGLNPAGGSAPFGDNGTVPQGSQVAFMQADGIMSQLVPGFTIGNQYYLHYYENARSGTAPALEVKLNGVVAIPLHVINLVGGANPYYSMFSDVFVAETPEVLLEFIKANPNNGDCTVLIDNVAFVEVQPDTAPFITRNPAAATVSVGDSVTFKGQGVGSLPLTYQWLRNGEPISGETNATLSLASVQKPNEGEYSLRVSNAAGSATSATAFLGVYEPIPDLFNTGVGPDRATLADGAVDPHYKLIDNPDTGSVDALVEQTTAFPISDSTWLGKNTKSSWIGPKLNTVDSAVGFYTYRTVIDLTDRDPQTVMILGQWSTDNMGRDILVNGVSTGNPQNSGFNVWTPFAIYGTNVNLVAGPNNIDFVVENITDVGYTGLRVEIIASNVKIPPGVAPEFTKQPTSQVAYWTYSPPAVGDTINFTGAAAKGTSPLSFQWKKDGVALEGKTSPTLTLAGVAASDSGIYTLEVSNSAGTATSDPIDLCVCHEVIPGVFFGTGVDLDGAMITENGAEDPHYILVSSADPNYPGPAAITVNDAWPIAPAGPWLANGPYSRWIAPSADQSGAAGNPPGDYTFETAFNLSGYDLNAVTIVGACAVDNGITQILINGNPTGYTAPDFLNWYPFTLNAAAAGFTEGDNIIDIVMNNAGTAAGPTGLRMDIRGLLAIERVVKPALTITKSGNNVSVSWAPTAAGQTLQSAPTVSGPWTTIDNATNPYTTTASGMKFFRVVAP